MVEVGVRDDDVGRGASPFTDAAASRMARPWAGDEPVSTSNAPVVPTTRPTFTVAGSATAT